MKWALGLGVTFLLLVLPTLGVAAEGTGLAPAEFVGTWDTGNLDETMRYEVKADGTYVRTAQEGEATDVSKGTWRLDGDTVTIVIEGEGGEVPLKVRKVDASHLDFWLAAEDKDEDATVVRWVRHDPKATKKAFPLAGTWELVDEGLHWSLKLDADGSYAFHRETRGKAKDSKGTWKEVPGTVLLLQDGNKDLMIGFNFRRLEGERLDLTLGIRSGTTKTWSRAKGDAPTPPPALLPVPSPVKQGPVGDWEVEGEALSVHIVIREDGTFLHELKTPTGTETSKGVWKVEGDKLIAKPDNEGVTYELTWKLYGENQLELYDPTEKETTVLTRKGTSGDVPWTGLSAEAEALVGTWMARSEAFELKVVLAKDGTFQQTLRSKEGASVTEGVFNVEGHTLLIVVKGKKGVQRLPFELEGKTLSFMNGEEVEVELVRQDG